MGNTRGARGSGKGKSISGPTYTGLLQFQAGHRSQRVIDGKFQKTLLTRKHILDLRFDTRYEKYVRKAGLYGIHQIGHIPSDHALISALVERWREETHSFHFPIGEMTVTLQDVAVLLGLRVDGKALCLPTNCNWSAVVKSLLGREVDESTFRKRSKVAINMSWLHEHFSYCREDADEVTVQQHARAYLLMLVGSLLFTDHSGDSISAIYLPLFENFEEAGTFSWASGVLAFLYKELCLATKPKRKQFGGSVMLLQLWSWERLPMGRPTFRENVERPQLGGEDLDQRPPLGFVWSGYRKFAGHVPCRVKESYRQEIDDLHEGNVTWLPYENRMDLLPPICGENPNLWRTTAPLIHFWIVEAYNPGRVARQFNRYQVVPPSLCDTVGELHKMTNGRGKDWVAVHHVHVQDWENREDNCLIDQRPYDSSQHAEYMSWFSGASILYLQRPGGPPNTSSLAERVKRIATKIMEQYRDVADQETRAFARDLLHECEAAIRDLHEDVSGDIIFGALDDDEPGPSSRPVAKRPRSSASTSL